MAWRLLGATPLLHYLNQCGIIVNETCHYCSPAKLQPKYKQRISFEKMHLKIAFKIGGHFVEALMW